MSDHKERFPARPAVPLALWALLVTCAVITLVMWLSFSVGRNVLLLSLALSVGCAVAVACVLYLLRHCGSRELPVTLVSLVLVGLVAWGVGSACGLRQRGAAEQLATLAVSRMTFVITSDATTSSRGQRCRATAAHGGAAIGDVWLSGKELGPRGSRLTCIGRFKPLADDEYGISSWRQGVCGSITVLRVTTTSGERGVLAGLLALRGRLLGAIDPTRREGRALMAACVCGSRTALDDFGLADLFSTCGIAHVVAVSGAHLSLLAGLLSGMLEKTGLRRGARIALLAAVMALFVLFCGAPLSAVRAYLMSLSAFASQLSGRRAHALSSVCVVAITMALVDTTVVGQLGFQLSVLSVIGLCVLSPHASYLVRELLALPRLPRLCGPTLRRLIYQAHESVCAACSVTLVCQLVTLPITASVFGTLSIVAPLANLVAVPLMSLVLGLGLAGCSLAWLPAVSGKVFDACDLLSCPLLMMLKLMARLPFASVSVSQSAGFLSFLSPLVVIAWLLWWPRLSRRKLRAVLGTVLVLVAVVLAGWRYGAPARIVILDVGQGDAILVQDGPNAVLVDTGPDDAVVKALARRHVLHVDAVVITHLHDDHYGGLDDLVGTVGCGNVLVAQGVAAHMSEELNEASQNLTGLPPQELAYGDELRVGVFTLRMVWPQAPVDGDENSESIELLVSCQTSHGSVTALLTGDAEQDETGAIIKAGDVGDIDLLKVGHHGSEVSLTEEEAKVLTPELAVASAGEGNRYGHPRPECVEILEEAGATVLCTKDVGDVEIRPGKDGPRVRAFGSR